MPSPYRRGPKPRFDKNALIQAGAEAVRRRAERPVQVREVLGISLREITEAAEDLERQAGGDDSEPRSSVPLTPGTLYRQWDKDIDSYHSDVFQALFATPVHINSQDLFDDSLSVLDRVARWADDDMEQARLAGRSWFTAHGFAATPEVAERIRRVYRSFDELVVPALERFVEHVGLTFDAGPSEPEQRAAAQGLASMFTVITEGWYMRWQADPDACASVDGLTPWARQAQIVFSAATRPVSGAVVDR